jgi:hypothetical protein
VRQRSGPRKEKLPTRKPKRIDPLTRTAHHEAGHAVLSAAINDTPRHVSIKPNWNTLGRSGARVSARSTSLVQVHLAGFAAEHLLTGSRPRQLDQEVGFAILSHAHLALRDAFAGSEHHDGCRAVQEVLRMGVPADGDEIKREVERFYEVAKRSLAAVWPAVKALAKALLEHEELDREGVEKALGPFDLFTSVLAVQRAHGLLLGSEKRAR